MKKLGSAPPSVGNFCCSLHSKFTFISQTLADPSIDFIKIFQGCPCSGNAFDCADCTAQFWCPYLKRKQTPTTTTFKILFFRLRFDDELTKRGFGAWFNKCFARLSPYLWPRDDKSASPPILPKTLNSDSPCYKRQQIIINKNFLASEHFVIHTRLK